MAEFVQTMKDWRRMCKTIGVESCEGCKLHADGNDCVAVYEGEMDYAKLEKAVTEWAAEHPEPVYPTWWSWLIDEGVIEKGSTHTRAFDQLKMKSIPAEIAEKLGLQPKEG